jgi:hypothetical protein
VALVIVYCGYDATKVEIRARQKSLRVISWPHFLGQPPTLYVALLRARRSRPGRPQRVTATHSFAPKEQAPQVSSVTASGWIRRRQLCPGVGQQLLRSRAAPSRRANRGTAAGVAARHGVGSRLARYHRDSRDWIRMAAKRPTRSMRLSGST